MTLVKVVGSGAIVEVDQAAEIFRKIRVVRYSVARWRNIVNLVKI
jgi:hypothetical protein